MNANYKKNVPAGSDVLAMKGTVDRLERTWERVANQLKAEGIGFVRPDGLKRYFDYLNKKAK